MSMINKKHSEETRQKMSLSHKGKVFTVEHKNHLKGIKCSDETKHKMSIWQQGEKGLNWKGDNAGAQAMHTWVIKWKGRPMVCEVCGTTKSKKYEWSNVDHSYRRILDDYIRMCTKCHINYDVEHNDGLKKYRNRIKK